VNTSGKGKKQRHPFNLQRKTQAWPGGGQKTTEEPKTGEQTSAPGTNRKTNSRRPAQPLNIGGKKSPGDLRTDQELKTELSSRSKTRANKRTGQHNTKSKINFSMKMLTRFIQSWRSPSFIPDLIEN
jgi:hypothetical protein